MQEGKGTVWFEEVEKDSWEIYLGRMKVGEAYELEVGELIVELGNNSFVPRNTRRFSLYLGFDKSLAGWLADFIPGSKAVDLDGIKSYGEEA